MAPPRPCLALLAVAALPLTALAQEKPPRAANVDQLVKLSGVPKAVLDEVKAERLFASDVYGRRALLKEIAEKPREDLLPLVTYIAQGDSDWPTHLTAVKVLSAFGLLADRRAVIDTCLPLLETNCNAGESQLLRYSMDEVLRLNRWFRFDLRLAPMLTKTFKGRDVVMRGFAYRGITQLKHPKLVAELVLPYTWEIFRDKKIDRDSRRHAIRTFAKHEVKDALKHIQKATREGPVAIVSAYALARFLDPSSIKPLQKINKSAVHRLRKGAWLARVRLNDKKCLKDVIKIVGDHTEHDDIKQTFLGDLGVMTEHTDAVKKILRKMATHSVPALKLGAALGLTRQGETSHVKLLVDTLNGPWEDLLTMRWQGHGWKRRFGFMDNLLRIEHPAANDALIAIMTVEAPREHLYDEDDKDLYQDWWRHGSRRREKMTDWYDEYRAEAVSLCGERRVKAALPKLREISKDSWGHLKVHALISQIELGDEKALGFLKWYLPKYDDRLFRQVKAIMGKTTVYTERMKWSTVFDICEKFERVGDKELYLPILEVLLQTADKKTDPMQKGWAKRNGGKKSAAGATTEKREAGEEPPLFRPPEVAYLLRNQFARRRIVECAVALAGEEAAPQLARALRDSRATVRSAALTLIGQVSGGFEMHPGSGLKAEIEAWPKAIAWLESKGVWPE